MTCQHCGSIYACLPTVHKGSCTLSKLCELCLLPAQQNFKSSNGGRRQAIWHTWPSLSHAICAKGDLFLSPQAHRSGRKKCNSNAASHHVDLMHLAGGMMPWRAHHSTRATGARVGSGLRSNGGMCSLWWTTQKSLRRLSSKLSEPASPANMSCRIPVHFSQHQTPLAKPKLKPSQATHMSHSPTAFRCMRSTDCKL